MIRALVVGLLVLLLAGRAHAACEVLVVGEPEPEEGTCGATNPPPVIGVAGQPPTIVAWAGGYDINPFDDGEMRGGLYVARVDGTRRRKIASFTYRKRDFEAHGLNLPDDHPSFSPDHRKFVFTSTRGDRSKDEWDIWVMNVNGSGAVRLAPAPGLDTHPVWSSDGTRILFSTERFSGNLDLAIMNADGTNVVQLTSSPKEETEPAWRHDGQEIAYTIVHGRGQKDIAVIRPNGTGFRQVTFADKEDHDATYDPSGTRIAITSERNFSPPSGNVHIIRVSDGADLGDLTSDLALGAGDPFWSRDGTLIAYFKATFVNLRNPQRLFVMQANGSGKFHIPGENTANVHPALGRGVDDDDDGIPNYEESGSVGTAAVTPGRLRAGRRGRLEFAWTHPVRWRTIASMTVRFARGRELLGAIRYDVGAERVQLFDGRRETYGKLRRLGRGTLRSALLSVDLRRSRVHAVDERTIRLDLAVRFDRSVGGEQLRVRVQAEDHDGNHQDEELAGISLTP